MMTIDADNRVGTTGNFVNYQSYEEYNDSSTYQCRIAICPEEDGGYSAHAIRLPGVVSEGETVDQAVENIRDAFRAVVATYKECGEEVPWENAEIDRPHGSVERWILVNV